MNRQTSSIVESDLAFLELHKEDLDAVRTMSILATAIVREHFDPIIGKAQNTYMIEKFQTEVSIISQLEHGSRYFFIQAESKMVGFIAFYPKNDAMYISKFYLCKEARGKGYAHQMLNFVITESGKLGLQKIELNVNKHNPACRSYEHLGFDQIRAEKIDIGGGFYMDDYVYSLTII